jgi:hypothetical protein
MVRDTDFSFIRRYPLLVWRNSRAEREGVAGYEVRLTHAGAPFALVPRAESELASKNRFHLLSVNEEVREAHPCRRLVDRTSGRWELTSQGENLLDLLTY